jgi:membrane protease subunit (stomatin/prohibitin family)
MGVGMAAGMTGLGGLQQPVPGVGAQSTPAQPAAAATAAPAAPAPAAADPMAQLAKFKEMLDAGLITQEDYDAAKARALGL